MTGMERAMGAHRFHVTIKTAKVRLKKVAWWRKRRWWLISGGSLAVIALAIGVYIASRPVYVTAPEVPKILAAQEGLNFGILIPKYMPGGFDRETVALKVLPGGPSGEAVAELTYRNTRKAAAIFLRQWVPGYPELETLNKSYPIETQWGKGSLMINGSEKDGIGTVWVDIGQLRVAVSSSNLGVVSKEQVLQMANTLGLASEDQVYTFKTDPVVVKGVAPPPPFVVPVNAAGVQELNFTITPGGYSPVRFLVKKGVPVKINFRALGEVGCGNTGSIDMPDGSIGLAVTKDQPLDVIDFTPQQAGDFPIYCSHNTYRGVMLVME